MVRPRLRLAPAATDLKIDSSTVADSDAELLDRDIGMMPLPPALIAAAAAAAAKEGNEEDPLAAAAAGAVSSTTGFGVKDAHLYMITSAAELKAAAEEAKKNEAFKNLASFYSWAFGSTTGESDFK